ncbi:type II secretion system secretin GspD [Thiothrix fructosivorans]|uniref:Type II secretion system secretin GspD n=1 Tax=Thiothrix fructosivorans TaxID=111770 RepID=A0A8B0SCM3_9GAMM|nr:type II secretion system secretin GspD [Thiothrix fructosivorans]MBO0614903.1 type II secretion system secretin GspD [Thiothrix fructosivorans]QTX09713.1 type II secretion system secretin GspD [Thiothrix fructosivorans]
MPSFQVEAASSIDLRDTDIHELIGIVAKSTGKNFIVDQQVRGKVTFVSGRGLDPDGLYEAFLSVLQVHGYEAVESGDLIKIVPVGKARSNVAPLVANAAESDADETITQVVNLEYIPVTTAIQTLMPLSGQGETSILPNQASNSLVLKGKAQNIERLLDVIASVDKPNNEDFELVPLDYAVASQVAQTLQTLMGGNGAAAAGGGGIMPPGGKVSADERTNSVLISGDKQTRERMKKAIVKLDVKRAEEGDTRVIQLRYAKAEDVVNVLNGVSPNLQRYGAGSYYDYASMNAAAGGAGASPDGTGAAPSATSAGVKVLADKSSNSIIISGPPTLQKNMMSVINQLDRRRAQVMVEAVIAEVSTDLSNKIGASLVSNGSNGVGYSNFGGLGTIAGLYSGIKTSTIPNIANGLLLGGGNDSFGAIVEALKGDAATNILSTPTLVTMDNEEAEITVGQEVPFITGKSTNAANDTTNPFTTIERKDVGLKFKITPQINRGETVNLKIDQETSNVASSSAGASDLITNKRRITTNVMVEDGQILVLGGLIEDNYRDSESKVPFLGDLPVLGNAFRSNTTNKTKNNLMVFIHPIIMPDGQSADAYTRMKYHTMQQQQQRSKVLQRDRLDGGASTLPPDMNRVTNGTADSLHNPPPPPPAPAVKKVAKDACNKSDPFCNGAL